MVHGGVVGGEGIGLVGRRVGGGVGGLVGGEVGRGVGGGGMMQHFRLAGPPHSPARLQEHTSSLSQFKTCQQAGDVPGGLRLAEQKRAMEPLACGGSLLTASKPCSAKQQGDDTQDYRPQTVAVCVAT